MQVWLDSPEIDGESVTFSWRQTLDNPFQSQNSFTLRYEGINLNNYATELFYEIFLALQIRPFQQYGEQVEVMFPSPVPKNSAEYWLAFHQAGNVRVAPVSNAGRYNPWANSPVRLPQTRKIALFFGGGKDSSLSTALLAEIYGPEQVLVVQYVGPVRPGEVIAERKEARQEKLMLEPVRKTLGVSTQRAWSNYQANFLKEGYPHRPHYEIYTVTSLPILLAHSVSIASFCMGWLPYSVTRHADAPAEFGYPDSHPDTIDGLSRHYRATFGEPIEIANVALPFNSTTAFHMLVERYPSMLPNITMCTEADVNARWCHRCEKCLLFAMLSASEPKLSPEFNYDLFFTRAPFVRRMLAIAESGIEHNQLGNVPWVRGFCPSRAFITYAHMAAKIDHKQMKSVLGEEAIANVLVMQGLYGNLVYPEHDAIPQSALDRLGPELGPRIGRIAREHVDVIPHVPKPWYHGLDPVEYDLALHYPRPELELEHLRLART